ncbi:hypothetical protein F4813DRAFT_372510 [Daldinia decipiens]|uniref:uncharacterized protein n=1 Tax=Daldinia decipiens TaxID=326647 RepID=UPI0020C4609C|nr:uncharacterized protein F4813DRAFT_372510 [Daldinia decipiens]KAI1654128.1 hypothetical protein F4813DRAFT_372510 [Daldinia decipiens]
MAPTQPEPTYTVFVRLPFPRGDFVDPPPTNWDSTKDEVLWSIVSRPYKTEIDWNDIANQFGVTVDFLLQQITWLSNHRTSQIQTQLRRAATASKGSAPSPQPRPDGMFSAELMRRTGSGDRSVRAPSALSIRKDSPLPRNDGSVPGTPMRSTPRPTATRMSSSNTAVHTNRNLVNSGKAPVKSNVDPQRHRLSSLPIATSVDDDNDNENQNTEPTSPGPTESSDSATSSSSSSPAQSRIIRRPPRFQGTDAAPSSFADDEDDDEDDDGEPAFLPYQLQADGGGSAQHDLSATLRGNPSRDYVKRHAAAKGSTRFHRSQTSDSSSSTAPSGLSSSRTGAGGAPVSPRKATETVGRSPGARYSKNSDSGTPSIGSSFSDLDDTSVTQSAMEEVIASQIQHGTISSLINATFRSRYLPGNSNQ